MEATTNTETEETVRHWTLSVRLARIQWEHVGRFPDKETAQAYAEAFLRDGRAYPLHSRRIIVGMARKAAERIEATGAGREQTVEANCWAVGLPPGGGL